MLAARVFLFFLALLPLIPKKSLAHEVGESRKCFDMHSSVRCFILLQPILTTPVKGIVLRRICELENSTRLLIYAAVRILIMYLHLLPSDRGSSFPAHCPASENPQRIQAPYLPGTLTVDGQDSDWSAIDGQEFALQPALHPESAQPYPYGSGSLQVKVRQMRHSLDNLDYVHVAIMYINVDITNPSSSQQPSH